MPQSESEKGASPFLCPNQSARFISLFGNSFVYLLHKNGVYDQLGEDKEVVVEQIRKLLDEGKIQYVSTLELGLTEKS